MLKLNEAELLACDNSASIFNLLSSLPGRLEDADALLSAVADGETAAAVTDIIVEDNRRRQVPHVIDA